MPYELTDPLLLTLSVIAALTMVELGAQAQAESVPSAAADKCAGVAAAADNCASVSRTTTAAVAAPKKPCQRPAAAALARMQTRRALSSGGKACMKTLLRGRALRPADMVVAVALNYVAAVSLSSVCARLNRRRYMLSGPVLQQFWDAALRGDAATVRCMLRLPSKPPDTQHHMTGSQLVLNIAAV
eukprot:jgi/Ulvmu1/7390/UM036_0050.1